MSRLVHATLAHKAHNPKLHRVLKAELGRLDGAKALRTLSNQLMALLRDQFVAYRRKLPLIDPSRAAFFAYNTVEGIVCAALIQAPESLSDPGFAAELSNAVVAMLHSLTTAPAAAE